MKDLYDFGENKQEKKTVTTESIDVNVENRYDFVTEGNVWAGLAKGAAEMANTGYTRNMLQGAGAGAVVGGAANVVNNMTKRSDDPTKRGVIGSMLGGAVSGAGIGAGAGAGARFAARTGLGKKAIEYAGNEAKKVAVDGAKTAAEKAEALRNVTKYMSGGKKTVANGRVLGWNSDGQFGRNVADKAKKTGVFDYSGAL